jgi:hypothetical protein
LISHGPPIFSCLPMPESVALLYSTKKTPEPSLQALGIATKTGSRHNKQYEPLHYYVKDKVLFGRSRIHQTVNRSKVVENSIKMPQDTNLPMLLAHLRFSYSPISTSFCSPRSMRDCTAATMTSPALGEGGGTPSTANSRARSPPLRSGGRFALPAVPFAQSSPDCLGAFFSDKERRLRCARRFQSGWSVNPGMSRYSAARIRIGFGRGRFAPIRRTHQKG